MMRSAIRGSRVEWLILIRPRSAIKARFVVRRTYPGAACYATVIRVEAPNMKNTRLGYFTYCIAAFALSLATGSVRAYDWLQFGGDPQHSGNNSAETALTPANVGALVQKYQVTLLATADGTPVFLEGATTPSGVKDLLFVTTRDGRIVALDAQNGAQLWSRQYGPGTCQINRTGGACYTTSSPAIDPSGDYVYSYGLDGNVHKYQVGDGAEI